MKNTHYHTFNYSYTKSKKKKKEANKCDYQYSWRTNMFSMRPCYSLNRPTLGSQAIVYAWRKKGCLWFPIGVPTQSLSKTSKAIGAGLQLNVNQINIRARHVIATCKMKGLHWVTPYDSVIFNTRYCHSVCLILADFLITIELVNYYRILHIWYFNTGKCHVLYRSNASLQWYNCKQFPKIEIYLEI